jgi:hypothetical protein
MELSLDINDLTIDDVVDLETAVGKPVQAILGGGSDAPQGLALKALVWIAQRKVDPSFTFEDAGKVSFTDLNADVEVGTLDPPDVGESISS